MLTGIEVPRFRGSLLPAPSRQFNKNLLGLEIFGYPEDTGSQLRRGLLFISQSTGSMTRHTAMFTIGTSFKYLRISLMFIPCISDVLEEKTNNMH
jgi:hypothetical protein